MTAFRDFFAGLDYHYLVDLLLKVIPALLCIMIHEICHGLAAYAMGDHTAAKQGRLSLNPLHHVDWLGLLMLLLFHIGWAKPVSVDMRNFRHPKRGMAITALAGPVSNFVLAAVTLFLFGLSYSTLYDKKWGEDVLFLLQSIAYLSVSLAIFNLVPFPPLDGSKVLFSLLPDRMYMKLMFIERYGMIILLVIVTLMSRLTNVSPISAVSQTVYKWFFNIAIFANSLTI